MKNYINRWIFIFACIIAASIISIILVISASCTGAGKNTDGENIQDAGDGADNAEADAGLRENTPDSLPSGLDFNGQKIRILHQEKGADSSYNEIYADEEVGEVINDSIYRRNRSVEERLNVEIVPVGIPGGWNNKDSFLANVRTSVGAGSDDYDLIAGYAYYITTLAPEGFLFNWKNTAYVDLSKPWWVKDLEQELTIGDKLYFITGDISLSMLRNIFVTFFNKKLAQEVNMENPYRIAFDGFFTVDKMAELSRGVYRDLNGNGKRDKEDMYGFATTTGVYVDNLHYAFDNPPTTKGADGFPRLSLNTPKMTEIVEKTYSLFFETEGSLVLTEPEEGDIFNMFANDQALFVWGRFYNCDSFRAMESDYGILPYPKWDAEQAGYYTTSQDSFSMFCIPVTCRNTDAVGAAIEALCAESYRRVSPAYYEITLKNKYSRDDESSQMLDIIRDGVRFNFGGVNSISMDNVIITLRFLMAEKKTNFTSRYEKSEAKFQKLLDKLIDAYENLP